MDGTNPAQPSIRIMRLFDSRVATAELTGGADLALLFEAERACATGFAPKRRAEFAAGRLCARRALEALGIDAAPLLPNADRTPRWPPGITGSISHTGNYCCAVAAVQSDCRAIGIDAENIGRMTSDLDAIVFTPRESAHVSALDARERARFTTLVFSAKEAFYKCQYPITGAWLDFIDITIELVADDAGSGLVCGVFHVAAEAGRPAGEANPLLPSSGRFLADGDLVLTGIAAR